jgi:8-oxo-dGTP diphosphatase
MAVKGKYVYEWPRPMVTVDAVVFLRDKTRPKVLLIKRKKEPFRGRWVFPGGFLEMDEELADGAARELAEETGLVGVKLEQMHTFGTCGRDPRGRVISVAFVGTVEPDRATVKAGDDAAEAAWFDIDRLPDMAFDHNEMANMAIKKLFSR